MGNADALLQPLTLRGVQAQNRILMTPHGNRLGMEGLPTPRMREYYEARARGGVGLIATQTLAVYPQRPDIGSRAPNLSLWHEQSPAAIGAMIDGIHQYGTTVVGQVGYAGRQFDSDVGNRPAYAPSAIPWEPGGQVPRAMTTADVERFVRYYAEAAVRAVECGYDVIEIHGAHGYLIHQFLSPISNKRVDRYGGSLENRARFAVEIATEIRRAVGEEVPVGLRVSGAEFVPGGIVVEDVQYLADALVNAAGLDYFSISAGAYRSVERIVPPMYFEQGVHAHLAAAVKKAVGERAAVAASGRIYEPEFAAQLIEDGTCDFVGMMRALIADPDLPRKASGAVALPVRKCIGLNDCWRREAYQKLAISCAVNPEVARERDPAATAASPLSSRVVVIGAGPAGLETAIRLARRGCSVTVVEQDDALGGSVRTAALAAGREQMGMLVDYFRDMVTALELDVRLGTRADAETVLALEPDRVVVATGAVPVAPAWATGQGVAEFTRGLRDPDSVGSRVIVYSENRYVGGASVADTLARTGRRVTFVTPHPRIGPALEPNTMNVISTRLVEQGVEVLRDTDVVDWSGGTLTLRSAWASDAATRAVEADTVLYDAGLEPATDVAEQLRSLAPALRITVVGDSLAPRGIQAALWDALREGESTR